MKKKGIISFILLVLLIGITIGFSYLSTQLNITGTSAINNATWNVYWDNVQVTEGSVSATTPT
ncbi:MAG: hypothetical protein J6X28_02545, partial [Bacilli bacterium]|nr:hypothetical protein [Bacilli bacterium]